MSQERLFRLAIESGFCSFNFVPREGWSLRIGLRRGDEQWADCEPDTYDRLTTDELVSLLDVVFRNELLGG